MSQGCWHRGAREDLGVLPIVPVVFIPKGHPEHQTGNRGGFRNGVIRIYERTSNGCYKPAMTIWELIETLGHELHHAGEWLKRNGKALQGGDERDAEQNYAKDVAGPGALAAVRRNMPAAEREALDKEDKEWRGQEGEMREPEYLRGVTPRPYRPQVTPSSGPAR